MLNWMGKVWQQKWKEKKHHITLTHAQTALQKLFWPHYNVIDRQAPDNYVLDNILKKKKKKKKVGMF